MFCCTYALQGFEIVFLISSVNTRGTENCWSVSDNTASIQHCKRFVRLMYRCAVPGRFFRIYSFNSTDRQRGCRFIRIPAKTQSRLEFSTESGRAGWIMGIWACGRIWEEISDRKSRFYFRCKPNELARPHRNNQDHFRTSRYPPALPPSRSCMGSLRSVQNTTLTSSL